MGCGASSAVAPEVVGAAQAVAGSSTLKDTLGAAATSGTAAAVAGEGLLAVAQHLPWIAPVAFLIGAAVKAAHDVKILKGDALKFAKFVRCVEAILNEAALAGTLAAAEDAISQVRSALEATLAHMQKLGCQSRATAMLVASRDKDTFHELQAELKRCMDLVSLATAVSTNNMVAEKYEQGQLLAAKLVSLGGLDAVGSDTSKLDEVSREMEASDQLLLRSIGGVREEVAASCRAVEAALDSQYKRANESADLPGPGRRRVGRVGGGRYPSDA
jgi:hypothetical protein